MENRKDLLYSGVCAVLIAAIILLATSYVAERFRRSDFYSQSRLISMIVTQDQINLTDMAGNKRNVDMMLKFVGALTSAYINFELIPVGEVSTFVAVFESVSSVSGDGEIEIEKFEYHRKNLTITGTAATQEDYGEFLAALQRTEHFESVSGHYYLTTDDTIRFELECISGAVTVHLEFT